MNLKDRIKLSLRRNVAIYGLIAYPTVYLGTVLLVDELTTKRDFYADKEQVLLIERTSGTVEMIPFYWVTGFNGEKRRKIFGLHDKYVDKEGDGILDKHYKIVPTGPRTMAAMVTEKTLTDEDQEIYFRAFSEMKNAEKGETSDAR